MADEIKIKAGNGDSVLKDKEIAYKRSEKALYIGDNGTNVKVGDTNWEARIIALENKINELENLVADINARLDALTASSE